MLKTVPPSVIKMIARLFNTCMESNIYPDEWGYGHIVPIHKSADL